MAKNCRKQGTLQNVVRKNIRLENRSYTNIINTTVELINMHIYLHSSKNEHWEVYEKYVRRFQSNAEVGGKKAQTGLGAYRELRKKSICMVLNVDKVEQQEVAVVLFEDL